MVLSAKHRLQKMKDGVRIVNFARGDLVNSKDILEALQNGKVAAYATDFPSDELIGESGVIAIPHLGASTPESEDNCAARARMSLMIIWRKASSAIPSICRMWCSPAARIRGFA